MSRRRIAHGIASVFCGAIGIPAVTVANHLESLRKPGSAELLFFMDRHGLVAKPDISREQSAVAGGVLALTDESAIFIVLVTGVSCGLLAMLLAISAERRREYNLYSAAGYICGAMAIALVSYPVGLLTMAAGWLCVRAIRRRRAQ